MKDKPCEYCKEPLTHTKGESEKIYMKKRFHKPCKQDWMRENGKGFYVSLWSKKE